MQAMLWETTHQLYYVEHRLSDEKYVHGFTHYDTHRHIL